MRFSDYIFILKNIMLQLKKSILIYTCTPNNVTCPKADDIIVFSKANADEYYNYNDTTYSKNKYEERFSNDDSLVCVLNGKDIISRGWLRYNKPVSLFIGGATLSPLSYTIFLYAFFTDKEHRNKGHYGRLIKYIQYANLGKNLCIFAYDDNIGSIKVIKRNSFNMVTKARLWAIHKKYKLG